MNILLLLSFILMNPLFLENSIARSTSFDPKAFEYAWRILMGEDTNQVLQGLNNFAQNRVKTYIDAITRWAVEGAAGQQR